MNEGTKLNECCCCRVGGGLTAGGAVGSKPPAEPVSCLHGFTARKPRSVKASIVNRLHITILLNRPQTISEAQL